MLRHTGLAHSCQARTTSRHPGTSVDSERPRPEITFLTWAFLVELPGIEPDPSRPAETSRLKTRKHAKLRVATCGYVERCWRCNSERVSDAFPSTSGRGPTSRVSWLRYRLTGGKSRRQAGHAPRSAAERDGHRGGRVANAIERSVPASHVTATCHFGHGPSHIGRQV
jgi:hypothetical protein